jgi:O-antigen biosynthesis protein
MPGDEKPLRKGDVAGVSLPTSDRPLVSVIIPCYGKSSLTLQCLKSIARFPPAAPFEVIVVDDASGEPGVELLRSVAGLRLEINPTNLGFLKSCNRSDQLSKGDYLFFLNNDTLVCEGWLEPLLAIFDRFHDAGLAGSKLLFPDGTLQEAGGIVWDDGSAWNYGRSDDSDKPEYNYVREADYISGCAILVPRALWDQLGGFDEFFAPAYCEDSDLAFRIRAAGRKVYYCPFSAIVHLEGASQGTDVTSGIKAHQVENTKKLCERWRETLSKEQLPPGVEIMRARDRSRDRRPP